jgi:VWFA-related protein
MNRIPALAACLALVGIAAAAAAQDPPPPPSFKAGVDLVRLDVRVSDAEGRAVRDIRQEEMEVVEDGENRPVVFFQHIAEPTESFADAASHTVGGEVSTNQGAARGHLYVLIFDQQHLTAGNEQRVRQAAEVFVRTRLRPGDRVALYGLPGPGPQIAFTGDARRITGELVKVRGMAQPDGFSALGTMTVQEAFQIGRGNEQILQRVADRLQSQSGAADAARRSDPSSLSTSALATNNLVKEEARKIADVADGETRRVLAMMSDVLRPMRAIEGRKSVLFVSEGFFGDHVSREIEEVAAAASESYSVIHALDMNRRELDITEAEPAGGDRATGIHDRVAPLGSLAAETDGRLLLDASQRATQIFNALGDESQDYYLVGFVPRQATSGSTYRRVKVGVRRGGTRVSTRTGFTITDHAATSNRRQSIDRAFAAPFPQQALPIQYTTYQLRGSSSGMQRVIVSLAVELPIASAELSAPADVAFVVRSVSDGRVAASGTDVVALPQRHGDGATTGTGNYRVQFELASGDYLMRAIVREPGGLVGSADRRFTVRALDGPALESGDLLLSSVRGELPVRPAAYVGDGLNGVLELYGRTTEQLRAARVVVELVRLGDAITVTSGFAELEDIRTVSNGLARAARLDVPLQGVTPGTYVARARVFVGPDTVVEVMREVDVRLGQRAADDAAGETTRFDPREVVNGALTRQYVAAMAQSASRAAADARHGIDRLGAGDYPAAIAAFQSSLANDDASAVAAFLLGWAFHGAGDDREAISAWRRAAFMDPTIVPAHLALADMYVRLSQPALAVQALRVGLTALPGSTELLDRLSRLESRR